jgi:selenocysteine lyase/cysteine desulfurase
MRYQGSREKAHRSGIYTFKADRVEELFNYLKNNQVHTALRLDAVRISPHFYNQSDEISRVIDLCEKFYNS